MERIETYMSMPVFGIYEKALQPKSFDKMFYDARECGYETFELSLDGTEKRLARLYWGAGEKNAVQKAARDSGIKIMTACLSANKHYPLGSTSPAIVEKGLEIMQRAVGLCGELGIRLIQVPGFDVYDREPRTAETQKRYVDNLAKCVKYAERACVMLAIEPVEGNLMTVRDTMEVVNDINSCWLQIYPDVANINSLGIDPTEDLTYGKGHIAAVHMRDSVMNEFDATVPFGTGCLDFHGVFKKLDELKFCGPLVVEMWNEDRSEFKEYIIQAREYMEKSIREMRSVNV